MPHTHSGIMQWRITHHNGSQRIQLQNYDPPLYVASSVLFPCLLSVCVCVGVLEECWWCRSHRQYVRPRIQLRQTIQTEKRLKEKQKGEDESDTYKHAGARRGESAMSSVSSLSRRLFCVFCTLPSSSSAAPLFAAILRHNFKSSNCCAQIVGDPVR